jgi:hypothetical protein
MRRQDGVDELALSYGIGLLMSFYLGEHLHTVLQSRVESGFLNRIPKDIESVLFGGESSCPPGLSAVPVDAGSLAAYAGHFKAESIPVPQVFEAEAEPTDDVAKLVPALSDTDRARQFLHAAGVREGSLRAGCHWNSGASDLAMGSSRSDAMVRESDR